MVCAVFTVTEVYEGERGLETNRKTAAHLVSTVQHSDLHLNPWGACRSWSAVGGDIEIRRLDIYTLTLSKEV